MKEQQIVVLGAGYAGLKVALRLARKTEAKITLVNAAPVFVERVRLHQRSTDQQIVQHAITDLIEGTGIKFIQAYVTRLDPQNQLVTMSGANSEQTLNYDTLVYALGSMIDRTSVPGVRDYAEVIEPHRTQALHAKLHALPAGAQVVIGGGGLTGIETATEIAEMYPKLNLTLLTRSDFGTDLSIAGRDHIKRAFERLHITLRENTVIQNLTEKVVSTDKGDFAYDIVIWTGAFTVPQLAREAGITTNQRGQIIVDKTLRAISHPAIYVAGDAATIADFETVIRMACATALPMAAHVADNIAAMLQTQPLKDYKFRYYIRCISLGRRDGLIQLVQADDTPRNTVFTGRLGAFVKERVCRFAFQNASSKGHISHKHQASQTATEEVKVA